MSLRPALRSRPRPPTDLTDLTDLTGVTGVTGVTGDPTRPAKGPVADEHAAVAVAFLLSGFLLASWAVRVPDVIRATSISTSQMGLALLCVSLGGLVAMRPTGTLCERLGAGRVTLIAAGLLSLAVVPPGLASGLGALCASLVGMGVAAGVLNVAMNSLGVRLEDRARRPLLPGLHAAFSLGGLAGGLLGGVAASLTSPGPHLVAVGALGALVVVPWLARPLLASDRAEPAHASEAADQAVAPQRPPWSRRPVLVLGLVAGCTALGEAAVTDWGAAHLRLDLLASPLEASLGYSLFCVAMAAGRLGGHHLVTMLGETRLLVGGAVTAAGGLVLGATSPVLWLAWAGFALAGLGLANSFPLAIARAGSLGGASAVGLASSVGYAGLLLGPPVTGVLADHIGLGPTLALLSLTSLAAGALALALRADARPAPVGVYWAQARLADLTGRGLASARQGFGAAADRQMADLSILDPRYLG